MPSAMTDCRSRKSYQLGSRQRQKQPLGLGRLAGRSIEADFLWRSDRFRRWPAVAQASKAAVWNYRMGTFHSVQDAVC